MERLKYVIIQVIFLSVSILAFWLSSKWILILSMILISSGIFIALRSKRLERPHFHIRVLINAVESIFIILALGVVVIMIVLDYERLYIIIYTILTFIYMGIAFIKVGF